MPFCWFCHDAAHLCFRDGWRRQRSLSQRGSMTNMEANVTATATDAIPTTSQSKTRQRPGGQGSRSAGQSGSRTSRERPKERKSRTKGNSGNSRQQLPVRRSHLNAGNALDSESAYNTHEASDSFFDPSSHDHDSNGHEVREQDHEHLSVQDILKAKLRESQESDLPESQASNSENENNVKLRNKSVKTDCDDKTVPQKRISQSISSEEEEDLATGSRVVDSVGFGTTETVRDSKEIGNKPLDICDKDAHQDLASLVHIRKLQVKSEFEGVSKSQHDRLVEKSEKNKIQESEFRDKPDILLPTDSGKQESHLTGANNNEELHETVDSSFVDISFESTGTSPTFSGLDELESTSNEGLAEAGSDVKSDNPKVESLADEISKNVKGLRNRKVPAVHFIAGNELVREREITPLCSRDSTPTHTQSEVLLPTLNASTKRLRRVTTKSKSESDTETDEEGSYQLRRRKGRLQDSKESGAGRSSLSQSCRKASTAGSSSEGETEAHASECGRRVMEIVLTHISLASHF